MSRVAARPQPSRLPQPISRIPRPTRAAKVTNGHYLSRSGSTESLHRQKAGSNRTTSKVPAQPKVAPPERNPPTTKAPAQPKVTPPERKPPTTKAPPRVKDSSRKWTAPASRIPAQKPQHPQKAQPSSVPSAHPQKAITTKRKTPLTSKRTCTTSTDEDTDIEGHKSTSGMSHSTASESGSDTYSLSGCVTLDGIHFPPLPIDELSGSKLFEALAYRVEKWRFVGRYLGLDDGTLDQIENDNQFLIERCYKMFTTWRDTFSKTATYQRLAEALKNIMREDLLPDIANLVPHITEQKESGAEPQHSEFDLAIRAGRVDLKRIVAEFSKQKDIGHKHVEIRLQYHPVAEPQKERPLIFILPLDDLRVLSELCVAADRHGKKSIHFHVRYLK